MNKTETARQTPQQEMSCALRNLRTGARLAELRGERTQASVAKALGVSAASISMYECGKRTPRDPLKRKIARLYGKRVEQIFFAE